MSETICFLFQAEDGIRDGTVTGVQTCALPICDPLSRERAAELVMHDEFRGSLARQGITEEAYLKVVDKTEADLHAERSEERRVGKEGRSRWSTYRGNKRTKKKKCTRAVEISAR